MIDVDGLLEQASQGDPEAKVQLFKEFEPRLRRMVSMRIDQRLLSKLDTSDVVQETFIEYSQCIDQYKPLPGLPFYLWLRMLTVRKLSNLQRHFLGTDARDVQREVSAHHGPATSSMSLADFFVQGITSPSQVAIRHELHASIHAALNEMEPIDREILALRHFEQLSNNEAAQVLKLVRPLPATDTFAR